ncbi:unnamed protein product [Urochloa decumbens]|uniref:FCP1 homology domain-containing protein n=1 Tax=Urochloa decumbens TaxID=240449 RepID=A0ABC9G9P2_9POAL
MSNLESPAAAAERGASEREPAAASVPASDVTPKQKKKMKTKNKMQEQQESPPDLDSAEPAEVEDQGEAKGKRMEELEATDAAASALNGTPKCTKKKKKTKKKKNMMQEQQESPPDLDSTALAEAEYQGEAIGRGMEELEATDAAASALNGTSKCKKKEKKNKMQKQQESPHELDSTAPAEAEYQGEAKARRMEELEATNAAASAWNGTPKCKKKTKKKNKVQVQQECSHELDSTMAEEQGGTKGRGMEEQETTDASASALNGTPKGKKKKNKKMKKNNIVQEQQESPPELNSTAPAEDEELEEAKGRGMKEREVTNATASTLDGTPKCKKKTKKNNKKEQKETPTDLDSTAAAEAEEQEETKGRGMEEQEVTDAAASVFEGTLKCDDEDAKVNDSVMLEAKVKDSVMLKEEATGTVVSAFEGTPQSKKRKRKNMTQKEPESIPASLGVVGVNKIVSNKSENGCVDGVEASGHTDVSMDPINGKDSVMVKEETIGTVVSALEGTPQLKRKRKNKMQKQPESEQALSDVVVVNKTVSNKSENCCSDGVVASGHADVSVDPINGEDPSCAQSKANVAGVLENCSENSSLLQDSSAGSKRRRRKRKRGSPNRWPVFSSENGEMVGKHSLDSSTHHDLSCTCASCLVEACKEKIKNIYSPRGSLVRFQRKKLLILDLNGLLADINQDFHNAHKAHGKVRGKLVFRRPYSDDFLRFCFQNFELGIWSSRKRENVDSVVNILMKDLKKYLLFCWDMSYCTVTGCNTVDNKHKPLVLKELKKLWNKEEPTLPWELGEFSPSNTLLVDDSPYKALCNPPNTAIFPQPYSYRNERDDYSLGPGGDLRIYLERIASADDVQCFVRDNPFGQNSITESDPNWNFYVQIVNKVEKRIVDKVENQIVDTVKQIDVKMKSLA